MLPACRFKLTKAEGQKIFYFKPQDFVVFSKIPPELQVKIYAYYLITNKDLDNRILTLEHVVSKEQINWQPEQQIATVNVYRQEQRELMQGDQIRWLKNNEPLGICNGQTAKLTAIANDNITVTLNNDKKVILNVQELSAQHWDYAYAATTFVAQGADQQFTIALAKGGYSKEVLTTEINPGDVLIYKGHSDSTKSKGNAKLVKIVEIQPNYLATAKDRDNNNFELDLKISPNNQYAKNQAIWYSYPNPLNRKTSNIPKLTSNKEFLVSVTRGDQVTLLVDHIESYQHALQQTLGKGDSALEFLAPDREQAKIKVAAMTQNITGVMIDHNVTEIMKNAVSQNSLYQKSPMVTIEQIITKLHNNILSFATNWLGQPQKITKTEARWGKKGSLVVKLSGKQQGFWHNFEKGSGGKNLLSLYAEYFNLDFKTAIKKLAHNLMLDLENKLFTKAPLTKHTSKNNKANLDLKKLAYIHKIYQSGIGITGTLAEKYLREFRKVTGNIPEDFRFCAKLKHPELQRLVPALIAPVKNAQTQMQAIVRIFLHKDGNKLTATYLDHNNFEQAATVKANLGSTTNAAVIINDSNKSNTIYITEGIETALSIAEVKPYDGVLAALSVTNLKNVPLASNIQKVILCADYDGVNALSNKALLAASDFYKARGLSVAIAYPEKIPGMQKFDFNDVLKHLGANSIMQSLDSAVSKLPSVNQSLGSNKQDLTNAVNFNKELTR